VVHVVEHVECEGLPKFRGFASTIGPKIGAYGIPVVEYDSLCVVVVSRVI